jgi:hypothetical protein
MNQPCIYVLKSPVDDRVMYVGKSIDPELRFEQHIYEAKREEQNRKAQWIRELLSCGLLPILEVIERCDSNQWQERESFWIAYYQSVNSDLRNTTGLGHVGVRNPNPECIRESRYPLRLPPTLHNRIRVEAEKAGVSVNEYIVRALSDHLGGQSELERRIAELERRIAAFAHGD